MIASDISTDPLWANLRDVALRCGLRSAWSQPILSKDDEVLGTFCIYSSEPRAPTPENIQLLEGAVHVALIAIERGRTQGALVDALEEIKKSQEQLRRDEQEFRLITDAIPHIIIVMQPDGRIIYANRLALDYSGLTLEDVRLRRSAHAPFILKTSRESRQNGQKGFGKAFRLRMNSVFSAKTASTDGFCIAITRF